MKQMNDAHHGGWTTKMDWIFHTIRQHALNWSPVQKTIRLTGEYHTASVFHGISLLHHSRHHESLTDDGYLQLDFWFFLNTSTISVYLNEVPIFLHRLAIVIFLFVCCPCTTLCLFCVYERERAVLMSWWRCACILGCYASVRKFLPSSPHSCRKNTNWTQQCNEDASASR